MKIPQGRQAHLLAFCAIKHQPQKRKYTNEPYISHCRAVADMADSKAIFGYEVGLCHDLFEDTDCYYNELFTFLEKIGYKNEDALFICDRVQDLTDVFTSENYPHLNRAARKTQESTRLHQIHAVAQTVKYCDLIHNTSSIVKYDKGFAKKYLPEKEAILNGMTAGNKIMLRKCLKSLNEAKKELTLVN